MVNRLTTVLFISTLVLAVAATMVLRARSQGVPKRAIDEQATPVQEGVMTEKELQHARIYKKEYEWRKGRKLASLIATQVTLMPPSIPGFPGSPLLTSEDFIRNRSCEADAVIVGTIASKASQLTEDGTFTFTTYQLIVTQVLKNNPLAPVVPDSSIAMTRPGGAIVLNGRTINTRDLSFPVLELRKDYVLFLKFIPSTGAYKSFKPGGDFEVVAEGFDPVTREAMPADLKQVREESLLSWINSAALGGCQSNEER